MTQEQDKNAADDETKGPTVKDPARPIPPYRAFIIRRWYPDRTPAMDRLIEAHTFDVNEGGVLAFGVFFHHQGTLVQGPRYTFNAAAWHEVEEVNAEFMVPLKH